MAEATTSVMPFAPVWDTEARVLVLGSHPSVQSKQHGFYYMNPHNRFWAVTSALLCVDLTVMSAEEKARALLARHVALYDVVAGCTIVGSADATIGEVRPADLAPLIEGAPIAHVFLNGGTAYRLFCRYFPGYVGVASCLPSTSPANARWRLNDLIGAWRPLADYL